MYQLAGGCNETSLLGKVMHVPELGVTTYGGAVLRTVSQNLCVLQPNAQSLFPFIRALSLFPSDIKSWKSSLRFRGTGEIKFLLPFIRPLRLFSSDTFRHEVAEIESNTLRGNWRDQSLFLVNWRGLSFIP